MYPLSSPFRTIILVLIIFFQVKSVNGQTELTNVPVAFNKIASTPHLFHFKSNSVKIPSGGHLQGIQCLSDSLIIITASSGSYSYYLTVQLNNGKVNNLQKITDGPFRHAGGCQLYGHKLFVGVEDNIAKNRSNILAISFNDSLKETTAHIIAKRMGAVKRSTAGATGVTKTKSNQYLVAVGDWDSRNIDFYLSKTGSDTLFDSLTTYTVPNNQSWYSYQSLNLLTDTAGNIYLVGFALDGLNNRADLYKVNLNKTVADLIFVNTRNFKCSGGAGFRYGAGLKVATGNSLIIYACSRTTKPRLTINVFNSAP